jgi:hypothetical protein
MKKSFFFLLTTFLLLSCGPEIQKCPIDNPDNIIYTNLEPDIYITSIDSMADTIYWGDHCEYPYPMTSTRFEDIDLNGDSIDDYRISVEHLHSTADTVPGYWCGAFNKYIRITGLNIDNEIAYRDYTTGFYPYTRANYYDASIPITSFGNYKWKNTVSVFLRIFNTPIIDDDLGIIYVGIRMKSGNDARYGWIEFDNPGGYAITVKSFGLNNTPNNCINAGQQ